MIISGCLLSFTCLLALMPSFANINGSSDNGTMLHFCKNRDFDWSQCGTDCNTENT